MDARGRGAAAGGTLRSGRGRAVLPLVVLIFPLLACAGFSADASGSGNAVPCAAVAGDADPGGASFSAACRPASKTARTRERLLAYLKGLSSRSTKKLLSGQRVDRLEGPGALAEFRAISAATGGVVPAIMGYDFSVRNDAAPYESYDALVSHWNAGGLVHFNWHAANPANGNVWRWPLREPRFASLADVYTPGNPIYDNFRRQMVRVGDRIRLLEDNGVVITFAPFHEANNHNPRTPFWWDGRPPEEFKALWRYLHGYLVVERGLSNIIWVFAQTRFYDVTEYYPGDDYVDVVGIDYYPVDGRVDGYDAVTANALAAYDTLRSEYPSKPFAFTELGLCLLPGGGEGGRSDEACSGLDVRRIVEDISVYFPETVWWMTWDDEHYDFGLGNQRNVGLLLGDPRVVVLSDEPSAAK